MSLSDGVPTNPVLAGGWTIKNDERVNFPGLEVSKGEDTTLKVRVEDAHRALMSMGLGRSGAWPQGGCG